MGTWEVAGVKEGCRCTNSFTKAIYAILHLPAQPYGGFTSVCEPESAAGRVVVYCEDKPLDWRLCAKSDGVGVHTLAPATVRVHCLDYCTIGPSILQPASTHVICIYVSQQGVTQVRRGGWRQRRRRG